MASSQAPSWAALPSDLLLRVASTFGEDDRRARARVQALEEAQAALAVPAAAGAARLTQRRSSPAMPSHFPAYLCCRLALINTCSSWLAALEAAPGLMPALVRAASVARQRSGGS